MHHSVQLLPTKIQTIERKHPWIFSGALKNLSKELKDGVLIDVQDKNGNFLARGHFNNGSIAIRVLTFEDEQIDQAFYNKRILNAVELRRKLHLFRADNSICRLIHGEGDDLPGLIVDFYNGVAVIQCHSVGMFFQVDLIILIQGL